MSDKEQTQKDVLQQYKAAIDRLLARLHGEGNQGVPPSSAEDIEARLDRTRQALAKATAERDMVLKYWNDRIDMLGGQVDDRQRELDRARELARKAAGDKPT